MSLGFLATAATQAHAQSNQEPAAIERTIPRDLPRALVEPLVSAPSRIGAGGDAVTGNFTLGAVHIERSTAFSQAELSPEFEPYLATDVDESKLNEIAARITERYRDAGYLLSYAIVPPQNVQSGMVRIDVLEGRVATIEVEGAGSAEPAIEAAAASILNDVPLRTATLERTIGLIRDMPGFAVVDVRLARSSVDATRHSLKIVLKRNRAQALAYSDNRGAQAGARMRYYASATLSSLATTGDELRLDVFAIPGSRFRYAYGQVTAGIPLGRDGLRFTAAASLGDQYQRPAADRIDGRSTNISAELTYPVLRSRALTMVGKLSVNDWRSAGDHAQLRKQKDRLRVVRLGFDLSNESRTRLNAEFLVSHGLGFDGMTRIGDPLASRPDASGRFTKLGFTAQVARPIADQVTVKLAVAGQYSDRPLLSAEEFSLGGSRFGRAFDFNEITGDRGFAAGVEGAYRLGNLDGGPQRIELFGFVDGGKAFQAGPPSGGQGRSLTSIGLGTRFSAGGISFSAEAGVPMNNRGKSKSMRGFFSVHRSL